MYSVMSISSVLNYVVVFMSPSTMELGFLIVNHAAPRNVLNLDIGYDQVLSMLNPV